MKTNKFSRNLFLFFAIGVLTLVSSCKKDDDPKPVAEFDYTVDDLQVTFTDASTNATTYSWDFGDENTSTEQSPVHTYADYGTYSVTLEVKGSGGTATVTYDVDVNEVQPITIDGNFEDWADVPDILSFPDGEGRTLIQAKAIDSKSFLYFYVKGTSSIGQVLQMYIDADNNAETGWGYWNWFTTPGIEYLMEAVVEPWEGVNAGSVLKTATGPDSNWPWEDFITTNAMYESSNYVAVGEEKAIEFSLMKDMFTQPALGNVIRVLFSNSDNNWSNVGTIPPKETEAVPATYTMLK
ncbi:MAG TPA: PKD domain-containing protein [Bacteroidales bacterium]|nr:PKD domain-containing protein [Bacteroidales bacterium]